MYISLIGPFPPYRGGISDFNLALSRELDKSHDLQIINYSTLYPQILYPGKTQYKDEMEKSAKSDRILSSINPFAWIKTVNRILRFNPDIVVLHYWMPFFAPALRKISISLTKKTDANIKKLYF